MGNNDAVSLPLTLPQMGNNDPMREFNEEPVPSDFDAKGYSLSGKIMLTAIILLFFVILLMLSLHLYARWYLLRARRRQLRRRNRLRRRNQLVFHLDSDHPSAAVSLPSRGLDASVIASLSVIAHDPNTHPDPVECAVCLSDFEAGEAGRVLPKCNHTFHIECIDMWFHSHSTCPLCRAPVEPEPETQPEVVITVREPEPGSSSGLCSECRHAGEEENRTGREVSSSSSSLRRKPSSLVGVTVEVPSRNESFRDESVCDSPSSTQSSFRSPMSRMLSFKRILSRERKGSVSPSSGGGGCSSATAELNAERMGRDETQ